MRIHLIAIGGALMHNLALALQQQGHIVTGSDDEIYEPSYSRLQQAGLLPNSMGWHKNRISADLDMVIVGMHARADNPELKAAKKIPNLLIYSYPEYIYLQSQHKLRVVVAGSHGKTTTTSLIMHTLRYHKLEFDYAVGAALDGFNTMVKLSDTAPIIIIEGDEYFASPIHPYPKFWYYKPQLAVLTGIAWDHINVFPTFEQYEQAFMQFVASMPKPSTLIYYKNDEHLNAFVPFLSNDQTMAYTTPEYKIINEKTHIVLNNQQTYPLEIFGEHNLQNIQAARLICRELGLSDAQIFEALQSFKGAAKRLQKVLEKENLTIFKDFAHAPSKVKATLQAVRQQFPQHKLIAAFELHTFSSLNQAFIQEYNQTLKDADQAFLYCNPHVFEQKKLPKIKKKKLRKAFGTDNLTVFSEIDSLKERIQTELATLTQPTILLLMSSGNWANVNLVELG